MTHSQIFISNTQYFCRKNKIRIQDLEEELGISVGLLSRIFRNGQSIKLETAIQISKKFGISVDEMVSTDIQRQERILELEKELSKLKKEENAS